MIVNSNYTPILLDRRNSDLNSYLLSFLDIEEQHKYQGVSKTWKKLLSSEVQKWINNINIQFDNILNKGEYEKLKALSSKLPKRGPYLSLKSIFEGLAKNKNVNLKLPKGIYPLVLAASWGWHSIAETLLKNGASVKIAQETNPFIFHAIYHGQPKIVSLLLHYKANVNEGAHQVTPIHYALREELFRKNKNHSDTIRILIENKADLNEKNKYGQTALALITTNTDFDCIRPLLPT